jgi:catechol 2,3-dioxygenase-like lactoylglutathione lyase family enzyme
MAYAYATRDQTDFFRTHGRLDIWHVAFPVADIDRSVAFYCDGLGFHLVGRDADSAFVSLGMGGFTIELMAASDAATAGPRHAPDHIAFTTSDLDAYRLSLIEAGLTVPDVQVIGEGMKRFALDDPDGVRLDFFQGREGLEAFISGAG